MIEGINRGAFPAANLTNPVTPISQHRQGEKSSLSSSSETKEKSCLSKCWSCCKALLQLLFFPITLTYLVFKNLCCPSPEKAKEADEETGSSTILVGTYGAPYSIRKRQGEQKVAISEAEGHPMEVMAKYAGKKVTALLDLSRDHEKKVLVPELQLHQLIENQMGEVTKRGMIATLSNYPFTPKKLEGTAKIQRDFRAGIIIAESVPYPKTDGRYVISGMILEGFNGKQIESLKEALRGQLCAAYVQGAEVLILDHFGSHHGTPSNLIRALYEKLLMEEFAGCFKKVIFVKRADDDALRPAPAQRTARDAMQLRDLKR